LGIIVALTTVTAIMTFTRPFVPGVVPVGPADLGYMFNRPRVRRRRGPGCPPRLYDIDIVISRTLVYGTLALFVTVVYVAVVVGIGDLIGSGTRPNLVLSHTV